MRPVIGIVSRVEYPGDTGKFVVNDEYRRVIIKFGGNPFLILPPQIIDYGKTKGNDIPRLTDEESKMLVQQLRMCDGIIMPGGFKILDYDFFILDFAIKNDIPILGICLGMQIMANYKRATIWNEKNDLNGINHRVESGELVHDVNILEDSKLFSIIGQSHFKVNSLHNYHVLPSECYRTVCYSEDGIIEGIEYSDCKFNIGVQWHPEKMLDSVVTSKLFSSFITAASNYKSELRVLLHK